MNIQRNLKTGLSLCFLAGLLGCGGESRTGDSPSHTQGNQSGLPSPSPSSSVVGTDTRGPSQPLVQPVGQPSSQSSPVTTSGLVFPEIFFVQAQAESGEGEFYPTWPRESGTSAQNVQTSPKTYKRSDGEIGGLPSILGTEIRFEKVIQVPMGGKPPLHLVFLDRVEGAKVTHASFEMHFYDQRNQRFGNADLKAFSYSIEHQVYFIPLNQILRELRGSPFAADPSEMFEIILNLELAGKGVRQWAIHFSVNPPLYPLQIAHTPQLYANAIELSRDQNVMATTQITNPFGRELMIWFKATRPEVGQLNTYGSVDRYPENLRTPNPSIVRTEYLSGRQNLILSQVQIIKSDRPKPVLLQWKGEALGVPLNPNSHITFKWWAQGSQVSCPSFSRRNREFNWTTLRHCTGSVGKGESDRMCEQTHRKTVDEIMIPIGFSLSGTLPIEIRVTDRHFLKKMDTSSQEDSLVKKDIETATQTRPSLFVNPIPQSEQPFLKQLDLGSLQVQSSKGLITVLLSQAFTPGAPPSCWGWLVD